MSRTILGIHSNVLAGDKTGGHAWLSITTNGATVFYGLWPDSHPRTKDNGPDSDIRKGLEANSVAKASRYYKLTESQSQKLLVQLGRQQNWNYTHNCSSWASYVVWRVVGEDVDADDEGLLGVETPRELGRSIQRLETKSPTSRFAPKDLEDNKGSSSSSSSFL